ncbi:hypothetical protein BGW36DRAFT_414534 [Talaromyces proteolyticus]|uniref:NmrA-like domain-containing protein n=1 Tax=Talaromyces proteolyticus TaxID=1131652 RepID=A0AAD4PYH0_9EURO|nr:uncharacterized protein BGW36DRAFT_414534 [Talaromyces proteolyticus]KAH8701510.1 hypothetical protein BGW36DRAFT_414534 [Talaromyces proteolyticus]
MGRVAIAGGTGGLGRSVTEEISATGKHDIFVLSRGQKYDIFGSDSGIKILLVDYSSPDSLAEILGTNNIDTIISTMSIISEEQSQAQLNLIDAAIQSQTVKRFAPSHFGIDYDEAKKHVAMRDYKCAAICKLKSSPLSFTSYICGFFLDYYGYPYAPTYLSPMHIVLDMENAKAAIPGNGEVPVVFTHSKDVGKFVAASLELREWPEKAFMVGDKVTLNELLRQAEHATGKRFDVSYDPIGKLKQYKVTELPANIPRYAFFPKQNMDGMLAMMGLGMAEGWFNFPQKTLNDLCTEVHPTSIEAFLNKYWKTNQVR